MKVASDYKVPPTVGWTLHHIESAWSIYPIYDGQSLDSYLEQHVRLGNVALPPAMAAEAEILLRELRSHVEAPQPYTTELGEVRTELHEHINHYFLDNLDRHHDRDSVNWNYELLRDGTAVKSVTSTAVALSVLSTAAQRAIDAFNGFATELVARSYIAAVHKLTDGAGPAPEFRKWRVFISYRKSDGAVAASNLRLVLQRFGNGAHFDCYIDQHNVQVGDWLSQFRDAIDRCDLFVATVTVAYGAPGSISEKELEHALAGRKLVAPIVVGPERPSVWDSVLKGFHAAFVLSENDVRLENPELSQFLRVCLSTLQLRAAAA